MMRNPTTRTAVNSIDLYMCAVCILRARVITEWKSEIGMGNFGIAAGLKNMMQSHALGENTYHMMRIGARSRTNLLHAVIALKILYLHQDAQYVDALVPKKEN